MLIRENVPEGRKLDQKIKVRWYLERVALLIPVLAFLYAFLYLLPYRPIDGPELDVFFALTVIASFVSAYAYVELRYRKFVYALREKDFLIQKGIIEKSRYLIPYEKIQNVTVSRDALDVLLGLGKLHIETAAHVIVENDI